MTLQTKGLFQIILLLSFLSLTSCMPVVKWIYGMQDPKFITDKSKSDYAKHLKIPLSGNYALDTNYATYLHSFDTSIYKNQVKNHYQPLQALYFNKKGQLVKFYVNCYAGGQLKLKWNRDGYLMTFLPHDQAPTDTLLDLNDQISFLKGGDRDGLNDIYNNDYTVFIYWNHFMKRHSKHLIHEIRKNCALAESLTVKIIYVNNDNFCAHFYK